MSDLENLLRPRPEPSTLGTLTYLLLGPLAWALQLTLVYAGHTLVCSQGGSAALGDGLVIVVSAVLAVLVGSFLLFPLAVARVLGLTREMDARAAYDRIARVAGVLALVAIVWTGTTAVLVEACAQGR
ncbi:hypothetical protein [Aquibium sp. ELW1220]|uniref:hypothetical protein n=1 Tax=Aquibium sp. ELW1220 TaxID=2976766 RepID=UPI0025B267C7|nr:hypothetical protein [Aquibium sp. ELW1220]MDN2580914.1 hypothetical protein [Aquibium sp. ELW1220]